MEHWPREHHAFAVEAFFKINTSVTERQQIFRRLFSIGTNGNVRMQETIFNWFQKFRMSRSAVDRKPPAHPRTTRSPENV
jgi:hypothetical protein